MMHQEKMMISKIKEYWGKFLDWEDEKVEFDKGWALLITVVAINSVLN